MRGLMSYVAISQRLSGEMDIGSKAVTHNRKCREGQAIRFQFGGGGKFRLHPCHYGVHTLQRQHHVTVPIEKQIDFSGSATGNGKNALQARDIIHRFFDWSGDRHQHLVDGHDAVVHADHDAWEIGVRKNGNGNAERQITADQRQADNQKKNRARNARNQQVCRAGRCLRRREKAPAFALLLFRIGADCFVSIFLGGLA